MVELFVVQTCNFKVNCGGGLLELFGYSKILFLRLSGVKIFLIFTNIYFWETLQNWIFVVVSVLNA